MVGAAGLLPGAMLAATPQCDDEPTPSATAGPFYTPNTPERTNLRESGIAGAPLLLVGRVLTTGCRPMAGALLDFWSCDGNGVYDNDGFRLRGHQRTDAEGRFRLETVKPGPYGDRGGRRTPHIHVRVQGRGTRLLTTQLFFPGEALNAGDWLFREELLVELKGGVASFEFVLA